MNLQIIAGQPIEFYVAMKADTSPFGFQAADSTPTLHSVRKNSASITPGGELVIGSVDSPAGYLLTYTPATDIETSDHFLILINYIVSGVTYILEYEGVAIPTGSETILNANYTIQVAPAIGSGSGNCDSTDRRKYNLEARKGDKKTFSIPVYQDDGVTPFDFTGLTLRVVIEPRNSATDRQVIEDADITIGGDDNNVVSFTTTNTISGTSETLKWELQSVLAGPAKVALLFGDYYVREGVVKD